MQLTNNSDLEQVLTVNSHRTQNFFLFFFAIGSKQRIIFSQDMVVVCKIPPILENHDANLIINEFKKKKKKKEHLNYYTVKSRGISIVKSR